MPKCCLFLAHPQQLCQEEKTLCFLFHGKCYLLCKQLLFKFIIKQAPTKAICSFLTVSSGSCKQHTAAKDEAPNKNLMANSLVLETLNNLQHEELEEHFSMPSTISSFLLAKQPFLKLLKFQFRKVVLHSVRVWMQLQVLAIPVDVQQMRHIEKYFRFNS